MLDRSRVGVFAFACLAATALTLPAQGQQTSPATPSQQPGFTLRTTTRIVLTDVTVTDHKGNPVHGLKESDFHIFDNGKPQDTVSFEEHRTAPVAFVPRVSTAAGIYSNNFLLHLPPVLNIVVIDTTNLEIVDQMYLNYELNRFIKQLPPDEPLAIYWRTGPASILLQNFTSDRSLLLAAVHKALPHFPPTGREYYSDFGTLYKIAIDFGQFPGRKNILWFSGGSTLFLRPDPTEFVNQSAARPLYDMLESSRIAIYPVDARGLTVTEGYRIWAQHALMNDIADATGGHAFYNNNGLDKVTDHWLDNSGNFYTLTYSPSEFRLDNKWHKVKIKLDTDGATYNLSYRRGYYADGSSGTVQKPEGRRKLLLSDGQTIKEPDLRSVPIIFQVSVQPLAETPSAVTAIAANTPGTMAPLPHKRGFVPMAIHYAVPAGSLTTTTVNGKPQIVVGAAVVSVNEDGSNLAHLADKFTLGLNADKLPFPPSLLIPLTQEINLRKGENYLYLAVWDMTSGRLGTLQIPLHVAAPHKVHEH
jgi:VWFA-related protein